ncbi:hypothetical protein OAA11_01745 [Schleiferiaceae bacterium]|nr:hypothetical protein [Schleiferiaceae bacterium]
MRRQAHQRPIGKGATGGELVFDKVLDDGETSSVYINNRAKSGKGKHYISLYKTGDDHLAGGTVMRSPGGLYARAGDSIKAGEDNGDQAPDIAENVPAIFFEAVTNDLVLHAPQGKVRIIAQQVELVASGPDGAGNIVFSANGNLLSKANETKIVSSGGAVFLANERVDVVAGTKLNTFGGNGETHAALKDQSIFSTILSILGGGATLEMSGYQLAQNVFNLK